MLVQGVGGVAIKSFESKNRQVAHTKLDSKIGICVEKFLASWICQRAEGGEKERATEGRQAAGTTNKEEGPARNTCVPIPMPVPLCVFQ